MFWSDVYFKYIYLVFMFSFSFGISPLFASPAQVADYYGNIPLAFTVNQGQTDSQVRFTASGSGCSMFFTPSKTVFVLSRETSASAAKRASAKIAGTPEDLKPGRDSAPEYESFAIKTEFVGANSSADIVGEERLSWNNNYFFGSDPSKWQTDVPNYKKVRLLDIYNGVDLVYYGNKNRMKYDFVVKPGQDPSTIAVKYDLGENSGNSLSVNAKGQLVVSTPLGEVLEDKPYCYQKIDGKEMAVAISYKIIDTENNVFGFELGEYDETANLVIDPELIYSTLFGGIGKDEFSDIAVDEKGCVYLVGTPGNIPVTEGSYSTIHNSMFITKFNSSGTALEYSTFFGDSEHYSTISGIAVDKDGNAYLTGYGVRKYFPVTNNAYDTNFISGSKGFVTKINKSGNGLIYSTFLGGNGADYLKDIAIDSSGNAYVTGYTNSTDFPVTSNAFRKSLSGEGSTDTFLTKINPDGTYLVFSTFIGFGEVKKIFINDIGESFLTGTAYVQVGGSDIVTFPYTENAFDKNYYGKMFITKINTEGSKLVYSTFLGGNGNDYANGLTVDSSGNAYVCGSTESSDFPVTSNAYDKTFNGGTSDGFITKIKSDGSAILYSTYIGGNNYDYSYDITHDTNNNIYFVGRSSSSIFPGGAGYVVVFNPDWKMLYGRSIYRSDDCLGIAIDKSNNAYIAGTVASEGFVTNDRCF